jgi:hypothetical protein
MELNASIGEPVPLSFKHAAMEERMNRWRWLIRWTSGAAGCLLAITLTTGCAAHGHRGTIPFGQWRGEGEFVFEIWAESGQMAPRAGQPRSVHRCYPTRLSIRPIRLDDREVIEIDIVSDRGELPQLGQRTHLIAALEKVREVAPGTTIYRIIAAKFNPGPDEKLTYDKSAPPMHATSMVSGGDVVLQLDYSENFCDTLRFRGDRATKTGTYFKPDEGLVQWAETLRRE